MVVYKVQSSLKQYMPKKPIKRGLKSGVGVIAKMDTLAAFRFIQVK